MKRLLPALALCLAACTPAIRPKIVTPPPSAPRAAFQVEPAEVQSREVGDDAWSFNQEVGRRLTQEIERALDEARKPRAKEPSTPLIRSRVYLAYGRAPVRTQRARRQAEYIEVRLELIEPPATQVRYSTFTKVKLEAPPFAGWLGGEDDEGLIEETLRKAARDFVSRL